MQTLGTGRGCYNSGVISNFQRFSQNSTGAVVVMRTKFTLTKNFAMKTSTNNSRILILTPELRRKTKQ